MTKRKEAEDNTKKSLHFTVSRLERNVACKDLAAELQEIKESKLKANQMWGETIWNFGVFIFFGVCRAVHPQAFFELGLQPDSDKFHSQA